MINKNIQTILATTLLFGTLSTTTQAHAVTTSNIHMHGEQRILIALAKRITTKAVLSVIRKDGTLKRTSTIQTPDFQNSLDFTNATVGYIKKHNQKQHR